MSKPAGKAAAKAAAPTAPAPGKVLLPQGSKEQKAFRDLTVRIMLLAPACH